MPIRVLLVDDSAVIRGLMSKALSADPYIEIAGTAANGEMAVSQATKEQPDIIILDIEMPVMDGLTALPLLLKAAPHCKIIMASTLTERNAQISMKALELGASDYLAKPSAKFGNEVNDFYRELLAKIKALAGSAKATPAAVKSPSAPPKQNPIVLVAHADSKLQHPVKALAIASSTGGPQALISIFTQLNGRLKNIPIFITQHMPATFTKILAEHLSKAGERPCAEAQENEKVLPGQAYIAPGDYHMIPKMVAGSGVVLHINQDPPENYCRPAADPMLRALSSMYGPNLLTLVLTGMGQDGMEGCKTVVAAGGSVVAQDEATCVVYGMPKAVVDQKLCRAVLPLPEIGPYLTKQIEGY